MRHINKTLFLRLLPFTFLAAIFLFGFITPKPTNQKVFVPPVFAQDQDHEPSPTPVPIIVWDKNRKLTWDDFVGQVPATPPANLVAESHVGVHSTWKTSDKCEDVGESGKKKCTATITEVSAQAEFDPNQSWVKPDSKTDSLLNHEQGHFDISEIFARKKLEQMKKFVGQSESAVADTDEKATEDAEGKIEKKLMEICDAIDKEEDAMQKAYDTQTKHGTDADQQKKWDEKIKKMLEK